MQNQLFMVLKLKSDFNFWCENTIRVGFMKYNLVFYVLNPNCLPTLECKQPINVNKSKIKTKILKPVEYKWFI